MHLLYNNWNDDQQTMYGVKVDLANATIVAFTTALTQYAVSQWIWFSGKTKRPPHRAPVYLVSGITFWILWSILLNDNLGVYDPLPLGYYIAAPIVMMAGVPLNLLFCWVWIIVFPPTADVEDSNTLHVDEGSRIQEGDQEIKADAAAEPVESIDAKAVLEQQDDLEGEKTQNDTPPPRKKVEYINNIKIFLTNMVILFHVTIAVGGKPGGAIFSPSVVSVEGNWGSILGEICTSSSQTFFMSLFFFFSGYFVPKSFDKRGTHVFLVERAKRLGIPFVLMTFVIGPYIAGGFQYLFFYQGDQPFRPPMINWGTTWFLQHTIVFSIAYAFACGHGWYPKGKCPSLLDFFGIAMVLGMIGSVLPLFFPQTETVITVPNFWNQYISYIVFFFGGALAQRNNWMEAIEKKPRLEIYLWRLISLAISMTLNILGDYPQKTQHVPSWAGAALAFF